MTGGYNYSDWFLSSTEVYRPSAGEWREVSDGALPRPMYGVDVVTLNNRVLLFGEMVISTFWKSSTDCVISKVELATTTKHMQISWSTLTQRLRERTQSGLWLGKCQKKDFIMQSP